MTIRTPQPPIPITKAIQIFRGILKGVFYLHSKGIVHGDLKVSNIMIENSWEELPMEEIGQFESNDGSTPQFPGFGLSPNNRDVSSPPEPSISGTVSTEIMPCAGEGTVSTTPEDSPPFTGKKFDL